MWYTLFLRYDQQFEIRNDIKHDIVRRVISFMNNGRTLKLPKNTRPSITPLN